MILDPLSTITSLLVAAAWPGAVSIVVFVGGTFVKAWIEKGSQHSYDRRLEQLRSELRKSEEELKAQLKGRDDQIAGLRQSVLSNVSTQSAALNQRQLLAAERLWAAVIACAPMKALMRMTSVLKMDAVLKQMDEGGKQADNLTQLANALWSSSGMKDDNPNPAAPAYTERPFVDPVVWSLFSAYASALAHPVAMLAIVRAGGGASLLAEESATLAPIKAAMPERAKLIDDLGGKALYLIIDELEERLLKALQRSISGETADAGAVARAAEIARLVDEAEAKRTQLLATAVSPKAPDTVRAD